MVYYDGRDEFDAADLIDWSQNRAAVGSYVPGHARGHTRAPLGGDFFKQATNCVEMFSKNWMKSAFLCRADQDLATHAALCTDKARVAMRKLNGGSLNEQVKCDISYLDLGMCKYNHGRQLSSPVQAKYVVLVLRRAVDGERLHIHNSYPMNWTFISSTEFQWRCSSTNWCSSTPRRTAWMLKIDRRLDLLKVEGLHGAIIWTTTTSSGGTSVDSWYIRTRAPASTYWWRNFNDCHHFKQNGCFFFF